MACTDCSSAPKAETDWPSGQAAAKKQVERMLFTQLQFWIFFVIVFSLYVALPHRLQNRMLLVASYIFYGAWDWRFLGLILFSSTVDYLLALGMDRAPSDLER